MIRASMPWRSGSLAFGERNRSYGMPQLGEQQIQGLIYFFAIGDSQLACRSNAINELASLLPYDIKYREMTDSNE